MPGTGLEDAFIELYTAEVLATYQDRGYLLPSFCRPAAVQGKTLYWHKLDKLTTGDATRAGFALHTLTDQTHTMVSINTTDREVANAMQNLDLLKTNVDFRAGYVQNQLALLGRYSDGQVKTAFLAGKNATVLGPGVGVGLGIGHIHQLRETFDTNYIPAENRYLFVTPRIWSQLLTLDEFVDANYIGYDELPYKMPGMQGKTFQTFNVIQYVDMPVTGAVHRCMAWHKDCMGWGVNAPVQTKVTYENLVSSWVFVTQQSMGAKVIDNTGVFEFAVDSTQATV